MVDDMESMQPRKMQSIFPQPRRLPTPVPINTMAPMTVRATINALPPTVASFLKLNSRPSPNIRNTTPILAQTCISADSTTVGRYVKFGLMRKPATIYPSTIGSFSFLKIRVTTPAAIVINAKSEIK